MTITAPETRRATNPAAPILTRNYDWRDDANCRTTDPDIFFPQGRGGQITEQTEQAKGVCGRCPVREACLDWALATGQPTGVWGGLSEEERRDRARRDQEPILRCLEEQEHIEARRAAGVGMRDLAQELGVPYETLRRALRLFEQERQGVSA